MNFKAYVHISKHVSIYKEIALLVYDARSQPPWKDGNINDGSLF